MRYVLGIDIGTASTKAVAVDEAGSLAAVEQSEHAVSAPRPGWVEHETEVWWSEVATLARRVIASQGDSPAAVCVSGMGPCLALATEAGESVRPAILYGIDTRATEEIDELSKKLGTDRILSETGSLLTSQAVGPKMLWVRRHEPEAWERAKRYFMPSSFAVWKLSGEYVLDHHSASQCNPLYDLRSNQWKTEWVDAVAPGLDFPRLLWPGEVAGEVTPEAAGATGLRAGTPVLTGTIDAWAEAISVRATSAGDTMLMYGSTMFLVRVAPPGTRSRHLWATAGVWPRTETLAAGMSTGGIAASWLAELVGEPLESLMPMAAAVPPGAGGLLALPYFAGERTPIFDPSARAMFLGLTLAHKRPALLRALLEGVALGVRHNLDALQDVVGPGKRFVAVGGGARSAIWPQIVSDVAGIAQEMPRHTIGASLGDAMLAAEAIGLGDSASWNPIDDTVRPTEAHREAYQALYRRYLDAYAANRTLMHELAGSVSPPP